MDLDLSLDLSPGSRLRISPRRSPLLLPPEAVSHGSPAHYPALERLSKDASALSEDLDELRSRIKRADVCKLYPDVPGESQLMISPTANPALSAIASSVLNDKVQSVRNDLASETQARLSGDDDNSRRLLRLEQKYNELDIRLRVVELERGASKKEQGDALKMAREEIALAQKDASDDLTSKLKEEIEEVKKDLEQKMITKDSTFREEIQKVKKETENALKRMFDEEITRVRKELKGHPGQSGKLDKIVEEINLYGKVYDEDDFHILQANREKAKLLTQQRRYEEAEEVRKWIWQKCQKKFGEEDRMTIEAQHEFATTLQLQEKFHDAEREQRDVLDKAKRYLTEDHPVTLAAMQELALTLWQLRRLSEAQALYKEALPLYRNAQEDTMVQDVTKKIEGIQNQKNPEEIHRVSGGSSGYDSHEQQKHVMLSGRFNNPKNIAYMNKVKALLDKQGIPTYMVSSQTGQRFSGPTMFGLYHAKAMVVFGTIDYGAKTVAGYETFYELQYAHEHELHLIPIQLSSTWPPKPDNDKEDAGKIQNKYVLNSALLRLNDEEMERPDEMAEKIAEAVRGFDGAGTEGSKDNNTISQQDPLELKKLETRVKQASENLVVEKLEAVKSNLKEVLREAMESEMEKFEAFTTKASKESEDNKRKMDEKSGELDKVVHGFTSDLKDFKAKLETKADSTRLNQEINQVQTEIQREREKREVLESETRDHKAKLAPMESRINEVELAEKQTKELVQRNAREMEAERQKAREETKREARELEANIQDDMKKRVKGLEEKFQSTLDGKAELVKLQQLQSDLLSRSEEKEQKLRQELRREIRECSEESQDKTEKVKKEMKDLVGQMESRVESFIRIIKGSATQIVAA